MVIAYLDLFDLYRATVPKERAIVRKSLDRDRQMERCLRQQMWCCFYCETGIGMSGHLDHVIPVYYGGENRRSNLVASCRDCNLLKGTQQMVITNPVTITFYEELKRAHRLWIVERRRNHTAVKNRKVRLYYIYRADRFRGRQP